MAPAERAAPPPSMGPHVVAPIVDASYDLAADSLVLKQGLACVEHFVRLRALSLPAPSSPGRGTQSVLRFARTAVSRERRLYCALCPHNSRTRRAQDIPLPLSNPRLLEMFLDRNRASNGQALGQMAWAGEFVGKWLTHTAQLYRLTKHAELRATVSMALAQLTKYQAADGYLGPFPDAKVRTSRSPHSSPWVQTLVRRGQTACAP